ncbi:MAG: transporter related [Gammaproteobacteria bacterium]|jgi:ABC-2 type transport system ATP-binding protein|nr:transporter related [Gammaproteobacteria bacterium]
MLALNIQDLTKVYANGHEALKGISLSIKPGEFFGLLGPNGAGKTTTIGILVSLVRKTSGMVDIFGHNIDKDLAAAKACIGLVPQEFNFNSFEKAIDILINEAGYYGIPRAIAKERGEYYLEKLGLYAKRFSTARQLSGGMKRRLMIARALVHEPKLLVLDEPTAGVDVELRRLIWSFLEELNANGRTIILTTHYLEEAEKLCSRLAFIQHGKIIQEGKTSELLAGLNEEAFVLDVAASSKAELHCPAYQIRWLNDEQLEVTVSRGTHLNKLFEYLTTQDIAVYSMRNRVNRLEELFVRLTQTEDSK